MVKSIKGIRIKLLKERKESSPLNREKEKKKVNQKKKKNNGFLNTDSEDKKTKTII